MPLNAEQKRLLLSLLPQTGTFSGKSGFDAIKWLKEFERIVDVYETPQVILPAFKLSMKDSAADWLSKLPPNVVGDFGLLRAAFLERFVPNQFQDELEPLLRRKQVSSENIQTYSDYFLGILGQMTDPPSIPRACKMFEAQLIPEIRTRLSIRNWDNLEALIAEAKLAETKIFLPLMNASAPVTSQLTEALAFRQREQPSAIYHQALSELQSLSATPAAPQSGSDITSDLKTFIRSEISSAFKELQAAITPNISLCAGEAKPDGYGPQNFPYANRGKSPNSWCKIHKQCNHSTSQCRVLKDRRSRNYSERPRFQSQR